MSESEEIDTVIQNFGAVAKEEQTPKTKITQHKLPDEDVYRQFYTATEFLYNKFKLQELTEEDFVTCLEKIGCDENGNYPQKSSRSSNKIEERDLDEILPVEIELDFQDGQVEVKEKPKGPLLDKACWCSFDGQRRGNLKSNERQDDKTKYQMKQLMTTFEQEKKKMLMQLEHDKEMILKRTTEKYERKLQVEKDFLGTVIADLVKSLDDARSQAEEAQQLRANERITLKRHYHRKLAEEKRKYQIEMSHG